MSQDPLSQPEEFKSFWFGKHLSPLAISCINTFRDHGFPFTLYTYGGVKDIPDFVTRGAADLILPLDRVFIVHNGAEHFSDIFRYELLRKLGGWWVDTDVVCGMTEVPTRQIAFAEEGEDVGFFGTGLLKFPKGHPFLIDLIDYVGKIDMDGAVWGATGPSAFTMLVARHGLEQEKWPWQDFFPLSWLEAPKFLFPEFTDEVLERTAEAKFVHLYNAALRWAGFDVYKDKPISGSYLDILYSRHCGSARISQLNRLNAPEFRDRAKKYVNEDRYQEELEKYGVSMKL